MLSKRIFKIINALVKKHRFVLYFLLSIWGMAISVKFIIAYLSGMLYQVNILDVFFDWGILFLLSMFLYMSVAIDVVKKIL